MPTTWKYVLAWFGLMVLAVLNGAARDFLYRPYVGDLAAHQISTVILLILIDAYVWLLTRTWKLGSAGQAWLVGVIWFAMTVVFEFGLGLRRGLSWSELLHTYDVTAGQIWILIPLAVLTAPYLFTLVHRRRGV